MPQAIIKFGLKRTGRTRTWKDSGKKWRTEEVVDVITPDGRVLNRGLCMRHLRKYFGVKLKMNETKYFQFIHLETLE